MDLALGADCLATTAPSFTPRLCEHAPGPTWHYKRRTGYED